jgi:glycine dehydrogenase
MKDLTNSKEFIRRHIGPSDEHIKTMLSYLHVQSLEELIQKIVPDKILEKEELKLDDAISEDKALKLLKQIVQKNKIYKNYLGAGYYGTITPNVILRNILENPGWYTAYTPYQPEVAQGRLEMLLNFQQMIIDLTKMDIANASLLDEATAAAEAVALCQRINPENLNKIFISNRCNLQTIDVVKTRVEPFGLEIIVGDNDEDLPKLDNLLCAIVQYPDSLGAIYNLKQIIDIIHNKKGKAIVVTDLLALTLIKPWVMEVHTLHFLQLKMNLKERCLEELLACPLIEKINKL